MPDLKEFIDSLVHVGAITGALIAFALFLARREERERRRLEERKEWRRAG